MSVRKPSMRWIDEVPGGLSSDKTIFDFEPVLGSIKAGKVTQWCVSVSIYRTNEDALADKNRLVIPVHVADNSDKSSSYVAAILISLQVAGEKLRTYTPTIVSCGKNIGRANETNIFCQALRDALGLRNKHARKYAHASQSPASASTSRAPLAADDSECIPSTRFMAPMLAQWYSDRYNDDNPGPSPIFVQRKYNGVRALCTLRDGNVVIYSRKGIEYTGFTQLCAEARTICTAWKNKEIQESARGNLWLDGELYAHDKSLQMISGIVRSGNSTQKNELQFHMFDVFIVADDSGGSTGHLFDARNALIAQIRGMFPSLKVIKFVETFVFTSDDKQRAIDKARVVCRQFVEDEGYEGMIIRLNTPYEHGFNDRHSKYLLKDKPIRDGEYTLVDYTKGERGRMRGALIFVCEHNGIRFNVKPTGEILSLIRQADDFERIEENGKTVFENHWKGRPLIVMYDEVSDTGIPLRARTDGTLRTCA